MFVCSANICRSPMAERLFLDAVDADAPVEVSSAGLHALRGFAMDAVAASALRELGVDPDGHAARQLTAAQVSGADLVLTATTAQRAEVVDLVPPAAPRVFTLREAAELLAGSGPGAPRHRTEEMAARRRLPAVPGAHEIGDPFGGTWPQMQACADIIRTTVLGIAAGLDLAP